MQTSARGNRRVDAAEVIARPASLDKAEFEALYRQWRSALWCVAAGLLGDRTSADDVVQDAAMIAYQRRDQFTPGTSFLAWAGRIVRNVALNARRRRKERCTSMGDGLEIASVQSNGSAHSAAHAALTERGELLPEQKAFDDRVLAALMQLSSQARACLLLRTVLELSYAEIAAVLDIPPGTAMSHVHRSRTLLRYQVLKDDDRNNSMSRRKT